MYVCMYVCMYVRVCAVSLQKKKALRYIINLRYMFENKNLILLKVTVDSKN